MLASSERSVLQGKQNLSSRLSLCYSGFFSERPKHETNKFETDSCQLKKKNPVYLLKLVSRMLGLAFTCKAWKENMPRCICLGWASRSLLNETFSPRAKTLDIRHIVRNVKPIRKSVLCLTNILALPSQA